MYYLTRNCAGLRDLTGGHCLSIRRRMVPAGGTFSLALRDYIRPGTERGPNSAKLLTPWVIMFKRPAALWVPRRCPASGHRGRVSRPGRSSGGRRRGPRNQGLSSPYVGVSPYLVAEEEVYSSAKSSHVLPLRTLLGCSATMSDPGTKASGRTRRSSLATGTLRRRCGGMGPPDSPGDSPHDPAAGGTGP